MDEGEGADIMASGGTGLFSRLLRNQRAVIWLSGLAALVAVIALSMSPISPFNRLQVQVFDTYQRLEPRPYGGTPITIVDIDEAALEQLGQWPWPRSVLARITDTLGQLGAAAIGFDVIFSEPDRTSPADLLERYDLADMVRQNGVDLEALDNDRIFAEAIGRNATVIGLHMGPHNNGSAPQTKAGLSWAGDNPADYLTDSGGATSNLPEFDAKALGIGALNYIPEIDGVVRRVPLLIRSGETLLPSLSVETLRVAQGANGLLVRSTGASGEVNTGLPAMVAMRIGALTFPANADGSVWVYYTDGSGPNVVSAGELAKDTIDPAVADRIAGHIVLVGSSAQGLRDQRATPMSPSVPGVTVHTEIIDQIVSGVSLSRPDWAPGLELIATVLLALMAIAVIPFLPVAANAMWAVLLGAVAVLACWFAFTERQMLLDPVLPVTGVLLSFGVASAARLLVTENQERFVRGAFAQYLAPTLVQQLARNPDSLTLGGETRELTLLFCDIRGFTSLSEGLEPEELTELLNNFLTPMTDVLLSNGATIDKYMGDAIMAFWNAPIDQENHPALACKALLEMQAALVELNRERGLDLKIGVGLNTGPCCVGNLGSTQRFNYSAIGDAVNVASRIEGLTKQYGLTNLIAETTAAGAPDMATLEVDRVRVVGRAEPLTILVLLSDAVLEGQSFSTLEDRHKAFLEAYYAADFDRARSVLKMIKDTSPSGLKGLYGVYTKRIDELAEAGVPENWDGVFEAKSK